ncbi:hypothetical protein [Membranihabitans marinus]|uniref:hypothetical protein n=1 Tax=Membranihabitans marinus TaxID=1227546 RepID=UPI001F19817A|nr:hypothetical protein [Membranihabitans marinus]
MVIGVDFDGTCVTHEFPKIGQDIGAVPVLKELVAQGHKLILYTMRSNMAPKKQNTDDDGKYLDHAVEWFNQHEIPLYAINQNPSQRRWTKSPKIYAHVYIDDAALGCPLIEDSDVSNRPFVDWEGVKDLLSQRGLL